MQHHLLAIDTSHSICSVALVSSLTERTTYQEHSGVRDHSERLLPMIKELCQRHEISLNEITAVAFSQGPGAFTGLRVACGVAQGLSFSLDIPVVPIVSHRALLYQLNDSKKRYSITISSANMGEVYLTVFRRAAFSEETLGANWQAISQTVLLNASEAKNVIELIQQRYQLDSSDIAFVGDAKALYPDSFESFDFLDAYRVINALSIAQLAMKDVLANQNMRMPHEVAPLYVRDKVAFTSAERNNGYIGNPSAKFDGLASILLFNDE